MKKYIIIAAVLIIGLGLTWVYSNRKTNLEIHSDLEEVLSSTTPLAASSSPLISPVRTANQTDTDKAWSVLQNYLALAKAKNIDGVISLSYQVSPSCKNYTESEANKKDCEAKMENVAALGAQMQKQDFDTLWQDNTQLILQSPWVRNDGDGIATVLHQVVFFIKEGNNLKLLSFNPVRGVFLPIGTSTPAQMKTKIDAATEDKDRDGMEDAVETCSRVDGECIKTNPAQRDTDGDGYWDGVQALLYK